MIFYVRLFFFFWLVCRLLGPCSLDFSPDSRQVCTHFHTKYFIDNNEHTEEPELNAVSHSLKQIICKNGLATGWKNFATPKKKEVKKQPPTNGRTKQQQANTKIK